MPLKVENDIKVGSENLNEKVETEAGAIMLEQGHNEW